MLFVYIAVVSLYICLLFLQAYFLFLQGMNKTLSIGLIFFALGLMVYNATLVNFEHPLQGDSTIALIGIVAPMCAVVLLLIFRVSKKIEKRVKGGSTLMD